MDRALFDRQVAAVRRFNRFYTRKLGILDEGLLQSPFSLTEARVLYEIATRDRATASDIRRDLGLDQGYLSRIVARLGKRGLIGRAPSESDGRRSLLSPTPAGRRAFDRLNEASRAQVGALLESLSAPDRERFAGALGIVERLLGGEPEPRVPYVVRPPRPGDLGWVIHRHGALYAAEYGWDETFEGFVAEVVAAFVKGHDAKREGCWIAEREGEIAGSVMLVRQSDKVGQLRLLYVEPSARRLGIGARLVEECVRAARQAGYRTLALWTNDVLASARRIYEAAGFELVTEEPHRSFGKDLVGQHWQLTL